MLKRFFFSRIETSIAIKQKALQRQEDKVAPGQRKTFFGFFVYNPIWEYIEISYGIQH